MNQNQVDALREKFYTLIIDNIKLELQNLCKTSLRKKSTKNLEHNIGLINMKCSLIMSLFCEDFYAPSRFIMYARNIREDRKVRETEAIALETRNLLDKNSDFLVEFGRSLQKIDITNNEKTYSLLHNSIEAFQKDIKKNTVDINRNRMFSNNNHPPQPTKPVLPKLIK